MEPIEALKTSEPLPFPWAPDLTRELELPALRTGDCYFVQRAEIGSRLLEQRRLSSESIGCDVLAAWEERWSENYGATWSDWSAIRCSLRSTDDCNLERWPSCYGYDEAERQWIRISLERISVGPPHEGIEALFRGDLTRIAEHVTYALSRDEGRTWTAERLIRFESGPFPTGHAEEEPAPRLHDAEYFRCNRLFVGNNVVSLPGGGLATPLRIAVPMPPEGGAMDAIPPFSGPGNVSGVTVAKAHWNVERADYDWSFTPPIAVPRAASSRGLQEPNLVILSDGRWMLEMRGSNYLLDPKRHPGRRWISISDDHGATFSPPRAMTYDDGRLFYAPSSIARLWRHRKTGKLHWIGNINATPPEGNHYRYPLLWAEIDETAEWPSLIHRSIQRIADRRPEQMEKVNYSNFTVSQHPDTGEMMVQVSDFGGHSDSYFTGDGWMLCFPGDSDV